MSATKNPELWLFCRALRPNARLRLFCVPYAGCGASAFNTWPSAFPETVELRAIQLPGRESRYREPALTDAYEAARLLADAIEPYLDRRYAIFGYSMGALIAFELIRELRRRGAPMPEHLFVGARSAPQVPATSPPLARLPRETFVENVGYYYDPPAAGWENPDLLEIVLPVMRADTALCEGYAYRHEPPFGFPIQAFAGAHDRSAPLSGVQAWREQTTAGFDREVFDGAHFFLNAALSRVHEIIVSRLEHLMLPR